jgi:hypothetical protein
MAFGAPAAMTCTWQCRGAQLLHQDAVVVKVLNSRSL